MGTVPFSIVVNVNLPLLLSASPGSQIANLAGSASYQINVSGIAGGQQWWVRFSNYQSFVFGPVAFRNNLLP